MGKVTIARLPEQLYKLLSPFSSEERKRVIDATLILLGDKPTVIGQVEIAGHQGTTENQAPSDIGEAGKFFALKEPRNKGEQLSVAARYRELTGSGIEHSKEELQQVFDSAHLNFDEHNFKRDMDNARRQAGLFLKGGAKGSDKLSYYGKQFVDALPDREAIKKLKKPKSSRKPKKASKKKQAKRK